MANLTIFQDAKTEPVVIDTFHAALDDLPLNLYQDPWLNENHHHDEFSLANPNDLSLDPSGTSGHPQLTYTYLVPSAPGTGTSTGGETSQNHTSNQAGFQIEDFDSCSDWPTNQSQFENRCQRTNDERTGTNGGTNSEMGSEITGEFPYGHEEHVQDTEPDGNFDLSESHIEKKLTERELSDPTWNIFRLSKMEEKLRRVFSRESILVGSRILMKNHILKTHVQGKMKMT